MRPGAHAATAAVPLAVVAMPATMLTIVGRLPPA